MKATIKDVAKVAGVSFKTVSRVINREPTVSEALRTKVWAAAEELNYQPNLSARQLRGGASFVAFVYDNPNSHYVVEMQHGMLSECKKQGYELLIHPIDFNSSNVVDEFTRLISSSHIAGLIITPPFSESTELLQLLLSRNVNFVRIVSGSRAPDDLADCVYINDFGAAQDITNHLISLGHRSIAFLGGGKSDQSSIERFNGYKAALKQHRIPLDKALLLPGEYSFDSGSERTKKLLANASRPTAIFACNDEIAAGALFEARLEQVEVPQGLSIAGFEDSPFSRQTWPKLTTAHQSNSAIAEQAANMLITSIRASRGEGGKERTANSIGFQPELLVRDSTCPVPS